MKGKNHSIRQWIIKYFIVVMLLSMALYAAVNLRDAYESAVDRSKAEAIICAENVTSLLDNECELDQIQSSPEDEIYLEAREVLRELCKSSGMDYVYVYTVDESEQTRYYYVCAGLSEREDAIAENEFSRTERPMAELLAGEKELLDGAKGMKQDHREDKYGDDIVWIYPYYWEKEDMPALIAMDYSASRLIRDVTGAFFSDMIPLLILLSIGMAILLHLLQKRIVMPIGTISDSMKRFAGDSRTKAEPLNIPPGDEIGEIAASYEKMTEDISTYINNIETLTREKLENDVQLEIARRIQNGLVPEKTGLDGIGFSISSMTRPAKTVGGDFYDGFLRYDGNVCIVMGDVSGKGISAAMFMAMIKTAIREKLTVGQSPAEALNRTNDEVCAQNSENLFATVFAAVVDPLTGEVIYSNAGHTYPVLLNEKPELLVPESGIALGMFEDSELTDNTLTLSPGQGLLLYTDGVTEAVNSSEQFFGTKRLLDAVSDHADDNDNPEGIITRISRKINDFCGEREPFDDMAALVFLYNGVTLKSLPPELPSFETVKKDVFDLAQDTKETRRALLACDEALTNIIHHSGATDLRYACDMKNGRLCIYFSDNGSPFDPTKVEIEEKEFDLLEDGGMGIGIIRETAESVHYARKNGRNDLTLYFSV